MWGGGRRRTVIFFCSRSNKPKVATWVQPKKRGILKRPTRTPACAQTPIPPSPSSHSAQVSLNSCGSALFLALKCAGVRPGDKVLTNAFTFTAVPSAIEHAGGVATYVETDAGFRIDVADLATKMDASGAKFLMVGRGGWRLWLVAGACGWGF